MDPTKQAPTVEDEQARFQREGREGEIFGEYLMRTADRREVEFQARLVTGLRAEVERLRALVMAAERQRRCDDFGEWFECAWCDEGGEPDEPIPHRNCPAFTDDGMAR